MILIVVNSLVRDGIPHKMLGKKKKVVKKKMKNAPFGDYMGNEEPFLGPFLSLLAARMKISYGLFKKNPLLTKPRHQHKFVNVRDYLRYQVSKFEVN